MKTRIHIAALLIAISLAAASVAFAQHRGPWDYKRLTTDLRYEDFGNFNYGAAGAAAGFGLIELHSRAREVQAIPQGMTEEFKEWGEPWKSYPYGDEPKDAIQTAAG